MGTVFDVELYDFFSCHVSCVVTSTEMVIDIALSVGFSLEIFRLLQAKVVWRVHSQTDMLHPFLLYRVAIAYEHPFTVFNLFTTAKVQVDGLSEA